MRLKGLARPVLASLALVLCLLVAIPASASAEEYIVKYGDTLSRIAARYNMTAAQLAAKNGIANVSLIRVGQRLQVPWTDLPNVRPIPAGSYAKVHSWDQITNYYAKYYHVDPDLIRRVIFVESLGNQYARSSSGTMGLMQLKPGWFTPGQDPYNPWTNIRKGTWILRYGFDYYHTWFKAVSWYCYGDLKRFGASIPTYYASLIFSPVDVAR